MEKGQRNFWIASITAILVLLALANYSGQAPFTGRVVSEIDPTIEQTLMNHVLEASQLSLAVLDIAEGESDKFVYLTQRLEEVGYPSDYPLEALAANGYQYNEVVMMLSIFSYEYDAAQGHETASIDDIEGHGLSSDNEGHGLQEKPENAYMMQESFTVDSITYFAADIRPDGSAMITREDGTNYEINSYAYTSIGEERVGIITNSHFSETNPEQSWIVIDIETFTEEETEEEQEENTIRWGENPGEEYPTAGLGFPGEETLKESKSKKAGCYDLSLACTEGSCISGFECTTVIWISSCSLGGPGEKELPEKNKRSGGMSEERWQEIHDQLYDKEGNCKGTKVTGCGCEATAGTKTTTSTGSQTESVNDEPQAQGDGTTKAPGLPTSYDNDLSDFAPAWETLNSQEEKEEFIKETINTLADTNGDGEARLGEKLRFGLRHALDIFLGGFLFGAEEDQDSQGDISLALQTSGTQALEAYSKNPGFFNDREDYLERSIDIAKEKGNMEDEKKFRDLEACKETCKGIYSQVYKACPPKSNRCREQAKEDENRCVAACEKCYDKE